MQRWTHSNDLETCSTVLIFLDRYSKTTPAPATSEGTSFAQKGAQKGKSSKKGTGGGSSDKKKEGDGEKSKDPYADMKCFKCGKTGHPACFCPNDSDKSSSASSGRLKGSLAKQLSLVKKSFAQLQAALENENESVSSSNEQSHFQFMHIKIVLSQNSSGDVDLRNVILLDSQSTVSLFCNPNFVSSFSKAEKPLKLQSNGGKLMIHHVAAIYDDGMCVWFSKKAITNNLSLKMVRQQYPVTYDCNRSQFVIHHVESGKPNLIFCMHPSGLHIYDPADCVFSFMTTVDGNKMHFSKRQIAGAEKAQTLHASLGFPSQHGFKWILQSNQVMDCPVTVQDAEIAYRIWGPNITELKGKTTRKTPTLVKLDIVQIPKEIRELHQCMSLSVDIFFVHNTPFLITLSRNIRFTTVTYLSDRCTQTIFKALKGIVLYYFQKRFQVTRVTVDGAFASLQEYMVALPGAPRLNLMSANEHEPYIKHCI